MPPSSNTTAPQEHSKPDSLTTSRRDFTVGPSPFNGVKFELGVVLILGVLLFLIQGRLSSSLWVQSFLLGIYGVAGMGWIVFRTHQVLRRCQMQDDNHGT